MARLPNREQQALERRRARGLVFALTVILMLFAPATLIVAARIVYEVQFEIEVEGRLRRAAAASTPDVARVELGAALAGIERRGLTDGNTGILWQTPAGDLGFWYGNIRAAHRELAALSPDATALEQTNVLMKLRETLLDKGEKGESVTVPEYAAVYPAHLKWVLLQWFAALAAVAGVAALIVRFVAD